MDTLWISTLCTTHDCCYLDTHMNGHLTFLEWCGILALLFYYCFIYWGFTYGN